MFNLDNSYTLYSSKYEGYRGFNSSGLEYVVLGSYRNKDKKDKKAHIKFIDTGYEVYVPHAKIKTGNIKDRLSASLCGVGIIGYKEIKNHRKEYNIWCGMIGRCYSPNNIRYNSYGALGIKVCDRWKRFDLFLEDIKELEGFDDKLFKNNLIVLDKDKKQLDKNSSDKVYSKDTCCFITTEENNLYRDWSNIKNAVIASKDGKEEIFSSTRELSRKYNICSKTINKLLKSGEEYKGWTFKKKETGN